MVMIAIGTGMRKGDHFSLKVRDVDFQERCIWVPNSKTGKQYSVHMSDEVLEILQRQCRNKGSQDHVFTNPATGKPYIALKKAFKGACNDARIADFRWHDLRHTFGMRLGQRGANAFEIMELMGRADIKTSQRYVHPTSERKRVAVEAIMASYRNACPKYAPEEEKRPKLAAVSA
jgi:integrase